MVEHIRPTTQPFFFGRISRDEAEKVLRENTCSEGLFLLRESMSHAGNYALSICHNSRVHHYSIERQHDGHYMIQDGKRFPGPVELVNHHRQHQDGFLTRPQAPCKRPIGIAPMAWPGVTMLELEQHMLKKAKEMGLEGDKLENVFGPQRQKFVSMVAKDLHLYQSWFHGSIDREDADRIMRETGHSDGKYLMRERQGPVTKSYALSLSYHRETKHYRVDCHQVATGFKMAIEEGPRFESLMDMIAHYYNKADGLLCRLSKPCEVRGFIKHVMDGELNPVYNLADLMLNEVNVIDEPDGTDPCADRHSVANSSIFPSSDDPQKIYDSVPRTEDVFNLSRDSLELHEKLGSGNFGSVMLGMYKRKSMSVPVAVKTLKADELPNAKKELMREARLMADLDHRNIVRMFGVCQAETIMLVLELASKGPLNKYLKKHPNMAMRTILELMFQVASGMAYLESKNFVHRDLAARNVLLVNETFAKISDFGMSKALGMGSDYYQAQSAGKWPLKWYAPECIYYFRFDSKSDVWSYGVTLWEGTSYGAKPYRGMKGQEILELIDAGRRLEKPVNCPQGIYDIMLKCWEYEKEDRPSFKEILDMLRKYRS